MTGMEAIEFIVDEIKKHLAAPVGHEDTAMKISRDLAYDLCKLTSKEIGPLGDKTLARGLNALREHGLFGYTLDIDLAQDGNVVTFGAS